MVVRQSIRDARRHDSHSTGDPVMDCHEGSGSPPFEETQSREVQGNQQKGEKGKKSDMQPIMIDPSTRAPPADRPTARPCITLIQAHSRPDSPRYLRFALAVSIMSICVGCASVGVCVWCVCVGVGVCVEGFIYMSVE